MRRQLPGSLVKTLGLLVGVVLVSGLTAVLTWVQEDELVLTWGQGNPAAREILAEGGFEALRESPIVPSFAPLAIVSFVVFALFAAVLASFLVDGHGWARPVLTVTVLFAALVAVLGIGRHLPTLFMVLSWVSLALHAVLLVFLWHKDTTAYLRRV
ncbi:MAG TPA: hypothetical protein VF728_10060 [Nocardioides sp.]|jgi:hypothetical protein